MSEHTPGPWFLVNSDRSYYEDCAIIETGGGEEVLGVSEWIRADAPDLRLMAAAPEMLEAAEALLNALDEHGAGSFGEPHSNLESAVSKAKGEQG